MGAIITYRAPGCSLDIRVGCGSQASRKSGTKAPYRPFPGTAWPPEGLY